MFRPKFETEESEDEKIILEQSTFKALASKTRVNLLKELDVRRKTLSELATNMNMASATVKEHLENLREANLIKLKDEGRKWKYYELTGKGKAVLYPERTRILVMLASILFIVTISMFTSFFQFNPTDGLDVNQWGGAQYSSYISQVSNKADMPSGFPEDGIARGLITESAMEIDDAELNDEMLMKMSDSTDEEELIPMNLSVALEQDEYGNMNVVDIIGNDSSFSDEELEEIKAMVNLDEAKESQPKMDKANQGGIEMEFIEDPEAKKGSLHLLNYFFVFAFIFMTIILIQDLVTFKKHKNENKKSLKQKK